MKATLLLCDYAESVNNGRLYVMGAGMGFLKQNARHALALIFEVPWDRTNVAIPFSVDLVDADGHQVVVDVGGMDRPVSVQGSLEVRRSPDHPLGTPITSTVAVNLSPLPLVPDNRYEWRLTVDGSSDENWCATFTAVRA